MSQRDVAMPKRIAWTCFLAISCALCLLLCACSDLTSDQQVVDYARKYATVRTELDMSDACVVHSVPDAVVSVSSLGVTESEGVKTIRLEPSVVSDTMASWSQEEWSKNWDDLYFNLSAHFQVVCKQAHEYSDLPAHYTLSSPDYMVVYDESHGRGFVVSSDGVYRKTDDPEEPMGEALVRGEKSGER